MKQETSPYRVFINTQEHEASAEVPVDLNTKIHFFATSGNKYVLEFQSVPLPLFLTDYYKEQETSSHLVLFGHSNTPLNFETLELNNLDKMSFSNQIGWLPTIGDFKKYWKLNLDLNQTDIFLRGDGGGIFTYKLKIPAIPHKNLKPVILNNSVSKTYLSEIKIKFRIPEADKADYMVSTEEKNPLPTEADQQQYVWNFENPNKGEDSSHLLLLTNQQYQWRLSHTIFRGFSSEMSYRIAMVLANGSQVNSLNEFSLNHWFETLFGWDNSLLSFQRWGISLKSFDPIKSFKLKDQTEEEINISTRTLDLKYRLTPGLWEHDETWGLILGYEKVRLNSMNPDLFGFGFFWARSMPKFFDDIFNYIPLLNYPKWVDMDFVFYSSSPNKEVKPGLNYNLNFHGKVLWTKSFFGEGGFGMNSFEFNNIKEETNESLRDFYGTFGLGFNF